jgi:hypothetical protein
MLSGFVGMKIVEIFQIIFKNYFLQRVSKLPQENRRVLYHHLVIQI